MTKTILALTILVHVLSHLISRHQWPQLTGGCESLLHRGLQLDNDRVSGLRGLHSLGHRGRHRGRFGADLLDLFVLQRRVFILRSAL